MKFLFILGTRPEIIKIYPLIKECHSRGIDYHILHTGQHYDSAMADIFFKEFHIEDRIEYLFGPHMPPPTFADMLGKIEAFLEHRKMVSVVLAEGDTNSVLAAALAASNQRIPFAHIEAGLRSFDERMPEERNRKLADHVSTFLFAPTQGSREYLCNEGIDEKKIWVTGNSIVDTLAEYTKKSDEQSTILESLGLDMKSYILFTAHRQENVDSKESLDIVVSMLEGIATLTDTKIIYPIHPRTKKRCMEHGMWERMNKVGTLHIIDPLGFFDFLKLEQHARLIVTDSGGMQEEACTLHVPCVTIRLSTERPESVDVGANIVTEFDVDKTCAGVRAMLAKVPEWPNPFGNGTAAKQMIDVLVAHLDI